MHPIHKPPIATKQVSRGTARRALSIAECSANNASSGLPIEVLSFTIRLRANDD